MYTSNSDSAAMRYIYIDSAVKAWFNLHIQIVNGAHDCKTD